MKSDCNFRVLRVAVMAGVLSTSATLLLTACDQERNNATRTSQGATYEPADTLSVAGRSASSNFSDAVAAAERTNRALSDYASTNKTALEDAADSARRAAQDIGQAIKEGAKDASNEIGRGLDRAGEQIQKEADRAR